MEKDKEFKAEAKETGLSEKTIQIISLVLLVALVIYDKILNQIVPPLPEYWYLTLFLVGVTGSQATSFMGFLKGKI